MFAAVKDVRLAPDTAPKEEDQVPEVTVPVVVISGEPTPILGTGLNNGIGSPYAYLIGPAPNTV